MSVLINSIVKLADLSGWVSVICFWRVAVKLDRPAQLAVLQSMAHADREAEQSAAPINRCPLTTDFNKHRLITITNSGTVASPVAFPAPEKRTNHHSHLHLLKL